MVMSTAAKVEHIREQIRAQGDRWSQQQATIIRAFLECDGHVGAQDLHANLLAQGHKIGLATVYRMLRKLETLGFALVHYFDEVQQHFEATGFDEEHHDHLICTHSGEIIEFHHEEIEERQRKIAMDLGFTLEGHVMMLYGLSPEAQKSKEIDFDSHMSRGHGPQNNRVEHASPIERFEATKTKIQERGEKLSKTREKILHFICHHQPHWTPQSLMISMRKDSLEFGQATLYRALSWFEEHSVLVKQNFTKGRVVYELAESAGEHHDHLICKETGEIIEFFDAELEKLQDDVARSYGYILQHHRMELYGKRFGSKN